MPHENGYGDHGDRGDPIDDFSDELKERYVGAKMEDNKPHLYAIVDKSFQGMFHDSLEGPPANQAIIITGESGAGKTFNTKKVLEFLDVVNAASLKAANKTLDGKTMTEKIKSTMPIMDAFGNACMPRNDDSSRFGKLIKIFYDRRSHIATGADITPYLLEKNRCCAQQSWERNFHCFYYMLSAHASGDKASRTALAQPRNPPNPQL